MSAALEALARATLYEGYLLYPYRPSSVKNRARWTFGGVFPRAFTEHHATGDRAFVQADCLLDVVGDGAADVTVSARFLHIFAEIDGLEAAEERTVTAGERSLAELLERPARVHFHFEGDHQGRTFRAISGVLSVDASRPAPGIFRVRARIENTSTFGPGEGATREAAQRSAFASTHLILETERGAFVSATDPPPELAPLAGAAENIGVWPVLVGRPGERRAMFAPPIILPDYPEVAPESPGDLFDGTEIDEILSLRVRTLADAEKAEIARSDPRAAALLARTEALGAADLAALHGALKRSSTPRPRVGASVRLWPRARRDVFDLALRGKAATVIAVEEELEGRTYAVVTVDDDPGRDLGALGQIGHRFFFDLDEVEVL